MEYSREKLLGSLLLFTRVFYEIRNGRPFDIENPIGREPHVITICRELTKCLRLQVSRELINIPPGLFKSTLLKYFTAWGFAHYADSRFLYISYSHSLAAEHTSDIKGIMSLPEYKNTFGIELSRESSAKDNFKTTAGGAVKAFGSYGAVVGNDGGLPITDRFSGAVIMDDMHNPDEVHSDTMREHVIRNYNQTIKQRLRSPKVPLIFIGQRLHEGDLAAYLINGNDGYTWNKVILPGRDEAGNSIHPLIYPVEKLRIEEKYNKYTFSSQIQQTPSPAGGGIFEPDDFVLLDQEPEMIHTFITGDTAETDKNYNDATVFGHWGIYKIKNFCVETDLIGLHLIDLIEERVEPKDLKDLFLSFYRRSSMHPVKPNIIAIEKASTGVSLNSGLKEIRGITLMPIERNKSKTTRFLSKQYFVSAGFVSLPKHSSFTKKFLEHMRKITANESHLHDDICDVFSDAVDLALIEKTIQNYANTKVSSDQVVTNLISELSRLQSLESMRYAG